MSIEVYGSSDDLVEIEGDIREEFSLLGDEGGYLAFSNGVVLSVEYGHGGVWRIAPMSAPDDRVSIVQAPADDDDNYSDRATVRGDVFWVVYGSYFSRRLSTPAPLTETEDSE